MIHLDYSTFDIRYSGAGHPAYHPRILLKLLIMGVLDRVRSSRRLARNARENVVYMYLWFSYFFVEKRFLKLKGVFLARLSTKEVTKSATDIGLKEMKG